MEFPSEELGAFISGTETSHRHDKKLLFAVEFLDGYSFRNLIHYLAEDTKEGNFIFSRDSIKLRELTKDKIVLNKVKIVTSELIHYEYYLNESLMIGVQFDDLHFITKQINKCDSFRIYSYNDEKRLYFQIKGKNQDRQNIRFLQWKIIDCSHYRVEDYPILKDKPNVKIPIDDFVKTCKSLSSVKCNYINIFGYSTGVNLVAIPEGDIHGESQKFGITDPIDNPVVPKKNPRIVIEDKCSPSCVWVPLGTIKTLAKLNNISNKGIIKMYIPPDHLLKIVTNIGLYGKLTIYIRNHRESATRE